MLLLLCVTGDAGLPSDLTAETAPYFHSWMKALLVCLPALFDSSAAIGLSVSMGECELL